MGMYIDYSNKINTNCYFMKRLVVATFIAGLDAI